MNFNYLARRAMGFNVEDALDNRAYKGGSQKSSSTSTSKPHQTPQYDKLLEGADKWLQSGGLDKNYGGSDGFDPVADMTERQKEALDQKYGMGGNLSDVYSGAGLDALKDSLGTYDPSKTGLNDALNATYNQMQWNFDTGQMPGIRQGATDAGQFGSSRAGIAEGLARDRLSQNMATTGAQMAMQDQQNWNNQRQNTLNNLSAISKGLGSGTDMSYNAGALEQGQQQAEIEGQLQKWAYENNVNLNDLMAYKQLISGDMGGTTKTDTKSSGGGGGGGLGALGSLGGAAAGFMIGGGATGGLGAMQGAQAGAGIGGTIGGLLG